MLLQNHNEYTVLSSYDLYEGMRIECEIFYKYNNDYILAIRGTTLTSTLLLKLRKLELTYDGLFVQNKNYDTINSIIYKYRIAKSLLEVKTQYSDLKDRTFKVIEDTQKNKCVNMEAGCAVSDKIKERVLNIDAASILQVMNGVQKDDEYLFSHSTNVALLNGLMGKWLNLSEKEIGSLTKIGMMHDVGKVMIPEEIINKPSRLTSEEFEIVKQHPVHSFDMLVKSGETDIDVLLAVRGHHEKINGTGYPDHLPFDRITLFSKITTISDIYDAMVSKRVYKDIHSPFEVLEEFAQGRFSNLDTRLINVFLNNMPKELLGKSVLLSDGRVGTVMFINSNSYGYPIVKVDDTIITTSPKIKCVSMCEIT